MERSGLGDGGEVTRLLQDAAHGNREAFDRVFPLVYAELTALAHNKLRFERPDHTLNTNALVHEAYLKLVDQTGAEWQNRRQFFAVASEAMRRILVDYARQRQAEKRGSGANPLPLDQAVRVPANGPLFDDDQAAELIALDDALTRLAGFNPQGAQIVQYRFFVGLSSDEVASLLGTSERTVRRSWTTAKAWLRRDLGNAIDGSSAALLRPDPGPAA